MSLQKVQKLATVKGFIDEYYIFLRESSTQLEAYEKVEKIHYRIFGRRRYKNFESFRQVKNRFSRVI